MTEEETTLKYLKKKLDDINMIARLTPEFDVAIRLIKKRNTLIETIEIIKA